MPTTHEVQHRAGYVFLIIASLIAAPASLAILRQGPSELVFFMVAAIGLACIFGFSWGTTKFVRSYGQRFWMMPGTWIVAAGYGAFGLWLVTFPSLGVLAAIVLFVFLTALWSNASRVGLFAGLFLIIIQIVAGVFAAIGIFWALTLLSRKLQRP
jgi:hypothetical protein